MNEQKKEKLGRKTAGSACGDQKTNDYEMNF